MKKVALQSLEHLQIVSPSGEVFIGGSQEWYKIYWQRLSGCGPTNGSNLMWYLSHTRKEFAPLCAAVDISKQSFLTLMENIFQYITPGLRGVNSADIFMTGAITYAKACGVTLSAKILQIPPILAKRPSPDEMSDYLIAMLNRDLPVAFLNLSNGALKNLDRWHWVTIIEFDSDNMTATICDQGHTVVIDLALWLKTSTLGGALVALDDFDKTL